MVSISRQHLFVTIFFAAAASWSPVLGQVVHSSDTIIDGSACVGLDCDVSPGGEDFGFTTVKLKENNLRIEFEDTSTTASFPSQDWIIVANESNNEGMNFFVIGQPVALVEGGNEFPSFNRPGENALVCPVPGAPDPVEVENPIGTPIGLFFDAGDCYRRLLTIKDDVVTISGDLVVQGNINSGGPGGDQICPVGSVVIGIEADGTLICGGFDDDDDSDSDSDSD